MAKNDRQLLDEGARQLGFPLDGGCLERLLQYQAELLKWSRKVNLIARETTNSQVIENHFLDSLTLAPLLAGQVKVRFLDVGTGAGFPGLVLAAVLPQARFTLVEPRLKRVSFLRHVIRTLGLTNTEVVADRVEPHLEEWQGTYSHVTSRAVAEPAVFLPMIRPLVGPDTRVLLMLAHDEALAGIGQEGSFTGSTDWRIIEEHRLSLPYSGAPRLIAVLGVTARGQHQK